MEKLGLDLDDGSSPSDQKQANPQARNFSVLVTVLTALSVCYHEWNTYIECKQLAVHHILYVPLASLSASSTVTYRNLNCYKLL
jgi:hypothetical protein